MRVSYLFTISAMCAACGSDPDIKPVPPSETPPTSTPDIGNASGSRLRRIDKLGADGSREFAGWYDSERDEDCVFRRIDYLKKPVERCLPQAYEVGGGRPHRFADAACVRPVKFEERDVKLSRAGNPVKDYVLAAWETSADDYVHLYVPGDVYIEASSSQPETVQLYELDLSLQCTPLRDLEVRQTHRFLIDVPLDEFVSWSEVVE